MKKIGFKPSPTNENKGYKTHGKFKNSGQKKGKQGPVGKESQAERDPNIHIKEIARGMMHEMDHPRNQGKL